MIAVRPRRAGRTSSGWSSEAGRVDVLIANAALPASGLLLRSVASRRSTACSRSTSGPRSRWPGRSRRGWSSAGAATSRSSPRCRARRPRPRPRSTRRRSSGCAGSRSGCARTCAPTASGVSVILPGLHPRGRDVRGLAGDAAAGRGHAVAGGGGAGGDLGDRAQTAPRWWSLRSRCGLERRSAAAAPAVASAVSRLLG